MTDESPHPHTQELTVLGLVALGKRYGFEMEEFIARTEMKRWNEIGNSTIYKLLKDLSAKGFLDVKKVSGGRGPARNEYHLTNAGEERLQSQILAAIRSDRSIKLDRLVGLFFMPLLAKERASGVLSTLLKELQSAKKDLEAQLTELEGDLIGEAIIGFYADVQAAEIKAILKVLSGLES
ncbi:PadR family transcriptional regulator [Qipengyuania sp. ASV99]|uniref:PadR family transcriptional regulator n=1 Tax=Qipengyuania sp. ASV99 TaxID=3399681 RepID=UPI003A4C50E9